MAEIYARIHPSSEHATQDPGEPFPVSLTLDNQYIWEGGPGGCYRHSDLQLMVKRDGQLVEIPHISQSDESIQLLNMILQHRLERAERGEIPLRRHLYIAEQVHNMLDQIEHAILNSEAAE